MRELSVSAASEPLEELDLVHAAAQVSAWCGEPLLYEGDDPAMTLAPGTARRRALDAALEEIAAGLKEPSSNWRFRFSLMLGLERVLASDPPTLANGLTLRPHQVDALAGMLAALTSSEEREAEADDEELNGDEAPGEELDAEDELEAGEDDELEAVEDEDRTTTRTPTTTPETTSRRSPRARRARTTRKPKPSRSRRSMTRAPFAATASSTRPRRARPSRPPASSRPAAPWACSS